MHRVALPLRVSMDGVRVRVRFLLEEPFDDVDGLPHPARDEVGEQRDVVVGDVVVGDPAVAAIADVPLRQQVLQQRVDHRPVGGDRPALAPRPGDVQAQVLVDHIDAGPVELLDREVADVGRAQLVRGDPAHVPGACAAPIREPYVNVVTE